MKIYDEKHMENEKNEKFLREGIYNGTVLWNLSEPTPYQGQSSGINIGYLMYIIGCIRPLYEEVSRVNPHDEGLMRYPHLGTGHKPRTYTLICVIFHTISLYCESKK